MDKYSTNLRINSPDPGFWIGLIALGLLLGSCLVRWV